MMFANVVFETRPEDRALFATTVREVMRHSREEAGCIVYSFTADLGHPDRFHITEIWTAPDRIEAHHETPHAVHAASVLGRISRIVSAHVFEGEMTAIPVNLPDSFTAS
jgi:quinol monooxygenase YgiN